MLMNALVLTQTIAILMGRVITLKGLTPVAALMDSRVTAKPVQVNLEIKLMTSFTFFTSLGFFAGTKLKNILHSDRQTACTGLKSRIVPHPQVTLALRDFQSRSC